MWWLVVERFHPSMSVEVRLLAKALPTRLPYLKASPRGVSSDVR